MKELVLVLGGARSGKSALGERLAAEGERVLFVATAEAGDEEMAGRIAAHRSRRPRSWETVESPVDVAEAITRHSGGYDTVLLDCVTLWVSNLLLRAVSPQGAEASVREAVEGLLAAYEESQARWVVVSNEVGLGVVPPSALGRAYRDVLGWANQALARRADKVYLVTAGQALELKGLGARSILTMGKEVAG